MKLEWGIGSRAYPGESQTGDDCLVLQSGERTLVAVVDGSGHGREAARSTGIAIAAIKTNASLPLVRLLELCHQALRPTHGAAVSLACLDLQRRLMTWAGVGDVEGKLIRLQPDAAAQRQSLLLRNGVLGARLPPLRASVLGFSPGDLLILATDGIDPEFAAGLNAHDHPQHIADSILARYGRDNDDALVVAARYVDVTP
ncbi:MAG: SpoIIE family protein phosphatase [Thermaerobacterales bacterium]